MSGGWWFVDLGSAPPTAEFLSARRGQTFSMADFRYASRASGDKGGKMRK